MQRLLAAKRDLRLERELGQLDAYDAVILDDIGYVQQSREEMEVLFTFLAERYERRSVIITSNVGRSIRARPLRAQAHSRSPSIRARAAWTAAR